MAARKPRTPDLIVGDSEDWSGGIKFGIPEGDGWNPTPFPAKPDQGIGIGNNISTISSGVKVATPETYELYPTSPEKIVAAQIFLEMLGGNELIELSRHDLINGINTRYQPIKDAQIIATQFNAFNIIPLQDTLPNYMDNFPIRLEERIPNFGSGESNVNIDANGIITIELINLKPDETVEVEILYQGKILSDTIYKDTGESS
jgi:hypothetical protein